MNNMEEIYFEKEARDLLFNGIQKLCNAVAKTMGPNGKTVIIPDNTAFDKYKITKDGVSVAREINFKNAIENIGAQLVKEVAELQVDLAGDGTTTAIVLANAFIQNLKDFDSNEINKAFDEIIPKVIEQLKLNSKELKREDIKYVASISANNDIQIGDIIQQAYNFSNIIKVEESTNQKDSVELINGMQLDVSYFSKHFVNNLKKGECVFDKPSVLLIDGKIEDLVPMQNVLNTFAQSGKPLLIIVEDITEKELRKLESNVLSGNIQLCVIKTPGFGPVRKDFLRDLSDFTGSIIVTNIKTIHTGVFGNLQSCKITKNNSLLIKHDDVDVADIIENLTELSKSKELTKHDVEIINKRIENLTAKVALIKVGGGSEIEVKEKYDRYDDAVKAVACALEEGIVEGGGVALTKAWSNIKKEPETIEAKLLYSILQPYKIIYPEDIIGYEIKKNMFDKNIIDPLKVTRCALENAVSIAKTVLSTDCIVLNKDKWN
jgi:chaperonin GroEL